MRYLMLELVVELDGESHQCLRQQAWQWKAVLHGSMIERRATDREVCRIAPEGSATGKLSAGNLPHREPLLHA
jgi:hypothetical protein